MNPIFSTLQRIISRTRLRSWLYSVVFVAIALASVAARIAFAPLAPGQLTATGITVVYYHAAGVGLILVLGLCCYAVGSVLLMLIERQEARYSFDGVIARILLGFATISTLMVALGFAGLLYRRVPIAIAVVSCLLAPHLWSAGVQSFRPDSRPSLWSGTLPAIVLWSLALFAGLTVIASRGLFWGDLDGDEWEHYLHYYDLVLKTRSIWPNEIWYHFYLSKGAGMFFFAALLGDVFSVQLASMLAAVLIAFIVFSFVRSATGSALPGLAAAALMLASWQHLAGTAGSVTKHHTVVAALILGIFWCVSIPVLTVRESLRRPCLITGVVASFYLAFFTPVAAAIVTAGLCVLCLVLLDRERSWGGLTSAVATGAAGVAGCGLALLVNHLMTGLALDAPAAPFWEIADKARFASVWNLLAIEYYFIGPFSFEAQPITLAGLIPNPKRWLWLLRDVYLAPTAGVFAAAATLAIILKLRNAPSLVLSSRLLAGIALLAAFVAGALMIGQIFQSYSVFRVYAFALAFAIMAIVLISWLAISQLSALAAAWLLVAATILAGLTLYDQNPDRPDMVLPHLAGLTSAKDAITKINNRFGDRLPMRDVVEFRGLHPDGGKMLTLTYDVGPAYFVPSPPLVSEPSYAFGNQYGNILFGAPEESARALKSFGIRYFVINLRSRLFLGIPYSELFAGENFQKYFGLAWNRGDVYVLAWRDEGFTEPLPERLVAVFRIKQNGVFPPDADKYGADLIELLRTFPRSRDRGSAYYDWLFEDMKKKHGPAVR